MRNMTAKKFVTASQVLCRTTLGSRMSDHNSSWAAEQTARFLRQNGAPSLLVKLPTSKIGAPIIFSLFVCELP